MKKKKIEEERKYRIMIEMIEKCLNIRVGIDPFYSIKFKFEQMPTDGFHFKVYFNTKC